MKPSTAPRSLAGYLDLMRRWSGRTYLVGRSGFRAEPWSFGRVREAALGLSGELARRGVRKGDKVLLMGAPSPRWAAAFFALMHRGAVAVPLDHESGREFIQSVFDKTEPVLALVQDGGPLNQVKSALSGLDPGRVLPFSEIGSHAPDGGPDGAPEPEPVERGDLAQIVFTSGTTAKPKGVMLTHGNFLANLEPLRKGVQAHRGVVRLLTPLNLLLTIPYSHLFGQAAGLFLPILIGSTVYYASDTAPASLVRAIRRDRILTLITVPRVMRLLRDHAENVMRSRGTLDRFYRRYEKMQNLFYPVRWLFYLDLRRIFGLRFWSFIVGAAALDPETHEFWRRTVYAVFQGYGLTETAPMVTMFNPFKHNRRSVGRLFPGQEVKVVDGEIWIRGENVMTGYYQDAEATGETLEDGWLKTGDLGEVDEQGHVYIKGRKKDMIVTAEGRNVFPGDLEAELDRAPGVRESVVVGMQEKGGEKPHAVLLIEPGADPEAAVQDANARLQPFQRIRSWSLWEQADFPRTPATGKVKKREVLRTLAGPAGEDTQAPDQEKDFLEEIAGSAGPDARLIEDLGLDSLDLVEAVSSVEKKYGVSIDESAIKPGTTVGDLRELAQKPASTGRPSIEMPRWNRSGPAALVRSLFQNVLLLPGFRLLCRGFEADGLEHLLDDSGPRILAANHTADFDPVAVLLALPPGKRKKVSPAMGLNRFGGGAGGLKYLLATLLFQAYPFPQATAYRASLEYTGELLDAGKWVLIFPEGRVAPERSMRRFRGGVGALAENTGAPVYPVAISGVRDLFNEQEGEKDDAGSGNAAEKREIKKGEPGRTSGRKRRILPRRSRVRVAFGPPLYYEQGEEYDDFAARVRARVEELLEAGKPSA